MKNIVCHPQILGGKPVIDGTRISVEQILGLIAKGMSVEAIIEAYPILTADDVRGAAEYARRSLRNEIVLDVTGP